MPTSLYNTNVVATWTSNNMISLSGANLTGRLTTSSGPSSNYLGLMVNNTNVNYGSGAGVTLQTGGNWIANIYESCQLDWNNLKFDLSPPNSQSMYNAVTMRRSQDHTCVGINTESPSDTLHVNGTARIGDNKIYSDGWGNFIFCHSNLSQGNRNVILYGDAYDNYGGNYSAGLAFLNSRTQSSWWIRGPVTTQGDGRLEFCWSVYCRGYISSFTDVGAIDFTGQHRSLCSDSNVGNEHIGLIVESIGQYKNLSSNNNIGINEALPIVALTSKSKSKKVYGVISEKEENETQREYKTGAFVSVLEKNDKSNFLVINSIGEGGIWICNQNGDLENGDYITSSDLPGYGMKQDESVLNNFTVAKITCDCLFGNLPSWIKTKTLTTSNGITYICAFVGCTYHCG